MSYASGSLGGLKNTGIYGTSFGATDVFVFRFTLRGVKLRSPEDVLAVLRAVAGGTHDGARLSDFLSSGSLASASTLPVDPAGIAVTAIGDATESGVYVDVVYHAAGETSSYGYTAGSVFTFGATSITVNNIVQNAQKLLQQTWPDAQIEAASFGRIEDDDAGSAWWLRQPIMWALHAPQVAAGMMGAPTQSFTDWTEQQVIVGNAEAPDQGLPVNVAFTGKGGGGRYGSRDGAGQGIGTGGWLAILALAGAGLYWTVTRSK